MKLIICKYILRYVFCVFPVEIAGMLLLPFILPFVPKGQEQLPRMFRWFDNHESHLPDNKHTDIDGLLGPTSERLKIGYFIAGKEIAPDIHQLTLNPDFGFFKLLMHRYRWIALRNPAYYFKFVVMGFTVSKLTFIYDVKGDIKYDDSESFWYVGDKEGYRKGWYFNTLEYNGRKYSELYAVMPYSPGGKYGLRMRIGYKMRSPKSLKVGQQVQFETSFTPFKKLGG